MSWPRALAHGGNRRAAAGSLNAPVAFRLLPQGGSNDREDLEETRESTMRNKISGVVFGMFAMVGLCVVSTAGQGQASSSGPSGPAVKPGAVIAKTGTPPPASATKATSIGNGKTTVSTQNNAADTDSVWVEKLDIDGDGDVDDTNLLWDDEDKVLYAFASGSFTCKNGGTGSGNLLIAAYAAGNPKMRPAGSGFWVADLDAGECGAQAAGLWGCKFDAKGNETACGAAVLDAKNDDLTIVKVVK